MWFCIVGLPIKYWWFSIAILNYQRGSGAIIIHARTGTPTKRNQYTGTACRSRVIRPASTSGHGDLSCKCVPLTTSAQGCPKLTQEKIGDWIRGYHGYPAFCQSQKVEMPQVEALDKAGLKIAVHGFGFGTFCAYKKSVLANKDFLKTWAGFGSFFLGWQPPWHGYVF